MQIPPTRAKAGFDDRFFARVFCVPGEYREMLANGAGMAFQKIRMPDGVPENLTLVI
jgi:hypothetical protein